MNPNQAPIGLLLEVNSESQLGVGLFVYIILIYDGKHDAMLRCSLAQPVDITKVR